MLVIPSQFESVPGYWDAVKLRLMRREEVAPWRDQYAFLRAYYGNNGLYDVIRVAIERMRPKARDTQALRNPAFRVVEFYAAKMWPGPLPRALPIEAKNKRLEPAIAQIWTWSNWATEKQTAARWAATLGDTFIRCATNGDEQTAPSRVHMENIDPAHVTSFTADRRGYLQEIRIDIPMTEVDARGRASSYYWTEHWTKTERRVWEHEETPETPLRELGDPQSVTSLATFGIDFIPIVWQPFRAVGDARGQGAFTPAIDKIDEANRQATRLSQMLFRHNRALWALRANAVDGAGRPMPAPRIGGSAGTLELGDDSVIELPGNSSLDPMVPPINYADALAILQDQMAEIKADLPELAYYSIREMGEPSGRAVRLLLSDALDRLIEARANLEAALVRAHAMCLTMGIAAGLFDRGLGRYEAGDFEHTFAERDPLPVDEYETAQTVKLYADSGVPVAVAAKVSGWSEEQIAELDQALEEERQRGADLAAGMMGQARRQMDQAGNGSRPGDLSAAQRAAADRDNGRDNGEAA